MDSTKLLKELGVDLKGLLLEQNEKDLRGLLKATIDMKIRKMKHSREVKAFIANILLDDEYISTDELMSALDSKEVKLNLPKLLEEPRNENEMKRAVNEEFRGGKFKVATEVPLPGKRGKAPRIDVAVLKKGLLGAVNIYAFELKKSNTRGEILKAFAQAKAYSRHCEQSYVAFTPTTFMKQADEIHRQAKENKEIGVWIVNSRKKIATLQDAYSQTIQDSKQKEIARFIEG